MNTAFDWMDGLSPVAIMLIVAWWWGVILLAVGWVERRRERRWQRWAEQDKETRR